MHSKTRVCVCVCVCVPLFIIFFHIFHFIYEPSRAFPGLVTVTYNQRSGYIKQIIHTSLYYTPFILHPSPFARTSLIVHSSTLNNVVAAEGITSLSNLQIISSSFRLNTFFFPACSGRRPRYVQTALCHGLVNNNTVTSSIWLPHNK